MTDKVNARFVLVRAIFNFDSRAVDSGCGFAVGCYVIEDIFGIPACYGVFFTAGEGSNKRLSVNESVFCIGNDIKSNIVRRGRNVVSRSAYCNVKSLVARDFNITVRSVEGNAFNAGLVEVNPEGRKAACACRLNLDAVYFNTRRGHFGEADTPAVFALYRDGARIGNMRIAGRVEFNLTH